jgi:HKD family nuclease
LLYIQDVTFSKSYSTHEALIKSCSSSIQGYGAYAFASSSGVDILFNDKAFDAMLERGTYSMIVGIDEITNEKCLDLLCEIKNAKPNFNVQAFSHKTPGSLFHPKISFFRNENEGGSLIIGSGNLTLGGMRKNREAFGLINLSDDELIRMEDYWSAWLTESSDNLKDIEDDEVVAKARENVYARKPSKKELEKEPIPNEEEPSEIENSIAEGWSFTEDSKILLAEIPKSGDRWKQANFDIGTFRDFFGATPGDNSQRVLLRSLNDDKSMSPIEVRPSVSVKSQNYRFELDAASGLLYPSNGKPIGIFIQVTTRMFLYCLFMPNHALYEEISDWMSTNWSGRADRMKRIVATSAELDKILNKSVFQHYKT